MLSMKKLFVLATISLIGLVACNKAEVEIEKAVDEQKGFEYTCRIVEPSTKTTLEGNVVTWEVNDQLGFYTSTDTYNTYKKISTISPAVTFTIYLSSALAVDDELYAYFPYKYNADASTDGPTKVKMSIPATQTNDFDAMPQVSKVYVASAATASGATIDLEFLNLGSVARFLVFSDVAAYRSETVQSITFAANKACAGNFEFDVTSVDYDTPSTLEISGYSESTVVVNASPTIGSTKDDAGSVNMVLAPGDYTGTVTVTTDEATYAYVISSAKTFSRAGLKPLGIKLDAAHRTPLPKKTYKKVTSTPADWEGEYILVNSAGNSVMTGQLSGNYLATTAVEANLDGTITCKAAYAFQIEAASTGYYALKNSKDKYICLKESGKTNVSLSDASTSDNAKFALSLSATGLVSINSKLQNTRYLTYGSGTDWRFYASTDNRGYLYALYDSRTPLDKPVVGVSVDGTTVTATWVAIANAGSYSVTISDGKTESSDEVTTTSKSFTGMATGTYTVTVVAKPSDTTTYKDSAEGVSGYAVVGTPTLVAPTITSLEQTATGFSAAWTAGDAYATGYSWEFRQGSTTGTLLGSGSTANKTLSVAFASLTIDAFTNGTKYYLLVVPTASGYNSPSAVSSSFTASTSKTAEITVSCYNSGSSWSSYADKNGSVTGSDAVLYNISSKQIAYNADYIQARSSKSSVIYNTSSFGTISEIHIYDDTAATFNVYVGTSSELSGTSNVSADGTGRVFTISGTNGYFKITNSNSTIAHITKIKITYSN